MNHTCHLTAQRSMSLWKDVYIKGALFFKKLWPDEDLWIETLSISWEKVICCLQSVCRQLPFLLPCCKIFFPWEFREWIDNILLEMKNCNTYVKPIFLVKYFTCRFQPLILLFTLKSWRRARGPFTEETDFPFVTVISAEPKALSLLVN